MELHLVDIIRFLLCILFLVIGILIIYRADDNNWMRRSAVLVTVPIYFNKTLGTYAYLMIMATLEAFAAMSVFGFILIGLIVLMLLPIWWLIHYLTH